MWPYESGAAKLWAASTSTTPQGPTIAIVDSGIDANRADFSNGDQFYAKAGQVIDLPEHRADRPGREFLEWHLDEIFLKAAAT